MQLELTQVQSVLGKLLLHYPESGYNGEMILELSEDYHEDLADEGITAREFEQGVRAARRRCQFFPKIADILAACMELRRNPPRQKVAALLEERSTVETEEAQEVGKKNCKIISMMLNKKITQEEALKEMTFFKG